MKIFLIRHGKTLGNEFGRYIGTTDESLSSAGVAALKRITPPAASVIYVSPMRRCIQTAEILYPNQMPVVVEELKECDFGDFENKNYKELSSNEDYKAWIESGGLMPFPGGESKDDFRDRILQGFQKVLMHAKRNKAEKIALVVHGGTIMAIMEAYDGGEYFSYQIKNGESCVLELDNT
ncbi:histidine phosphatase family protein [Eubacterium oxidoreducens]|uniref:Alpha-ribazole phosphatase n=1 Tax=Eubacterium oxidoreducens TaxID=1732 RepID=A0A1G6BSX4_EUBOX|nr:histidine phosphatase family protein [Eubacterium oxidoreducens]SDB23696.1 alpha-ribazole phosphatase [Eubacterium oxidoreducens]